MGKTVKAILLNCIIAILAIIAYSPAFIGLRLSTLHPIKTAAAVFIAIMLIGTCMLGNHEIITSGKPNMKKIKLYGQDDFDKKKDYLETLKRMLEQTTVFKDPIEKAIMLTHRMERKTSTLESILPQVFQPGELSYDRFSSTIRGAQNVFYANIQGILNKVKLFDEEDYLQRKEHEELPTQRRQWENIQGFLDMNQRIIELLDKLIFEIGELTDPGCDVSQIQPMKELKRLIKETGMYK